jgi:putative toxin-antitoxin system antitoxin component (TIGR02293 family)
MYAAVVEPSKIAQVLGLRRKVTSIEQLDRQVEAGLPKASLGAVARHVYGVSPDAAALMQRVIPSATFHRRGEDLKPQEGERVERLARVIATAEHVWDSVDDARTFLSTGHAMLGGKRPIEVALTELGARRVDCSGRCSMASRRSDPGSATSKAAARQRAPAPTWQAWRIADGRFDPFIPVGAALVGGRWNSPGLGVIYASRSYAGAMLECLAHAMLVACLWSRWTAPGEPELLSFAAITDEPPAEAAGAGHDRCIVPIKPEHVDAEEPGGLVCNLRRSRAAYYEHRLAA